MRSIRIALVAAASVVGSSTRTDAQEHPRAHLPAVAQADKQTAELLTFHGCGPDGDHSNTKQDADENRLKNRVDVPAGSYYWIEPSAITELSTRTNLKDIPRAKWTDSVRDSVEAHEGIPVTIQGYLVDSGTVHGAKGEGKEATNCDSTRGPLVDWHVWLVADVGYQRDSAIVVEFTPRMRARNPGWTLAKVQAAARRGLPVRVSGWTLFDPEHPEQLHHFRQTLWEVHPITKFEIKVGSDWKLLETWDPSS